MSAKFLERWPTAFKHKVIEQSKCLHLSPDLQELIDAAEAVENEDDGNDAGQIQSMTYFDILIRYIVLDANHAYVHVFIKAWDHDLAGILLLLHLIPPVAQGRKRPGKMSPFQAEQSVVVFLKVCGILFSSSYADGVSFVVGKLKVEGLNYK